MTADESHRPPGPDPDDEGPAERAGDAKAAAGDADATLRFDTLPEAPTCPFCGGNETEQFAAFGSAASTSQFYCRPCRSVFEFLKWRES